MKHSRPQPSSEQYQSGLVTDEPEALLELLPLPAHSKDCLRINHNSGRKTEAAAGCGTHEMQSSRLSQPHKAKQKPRHSSSWDLEEPSQAAALAENSKITHRDFTVSLSF